VLVPGLAPPLPAPPLFFPPALLLPPGAPHPLAPLRFASAVSLRGGGGQGSLDRALGYLAVLALLVLPAVDLGLAIANPESPTRSSDAIDGVNAYNDLARWPGSPCYLGAAPDPEAPQ
jgi:hypothetical protein